MKNKLLPIGTVAVLKGGKKKIMITGFYAAPNGDKEKICDYCGCFYPEGILKSDQLFAFNHSQIDKVLFKGYADKEEEEFKNKLSAIVNTVEAINQNKK